jgi:hypothetical protein
MSWEGAGQVIRDRSQSDKGLGGVAVSVTIVVPYYNAAAYVALALVVAGLVVTAIGVLALRRDSRNMRASYNVLLDHLIAAHAMPDIALLERVRGYSVLGQRNPQAAPKDSQPEDSQPETGAES